MNELNRKPGPQTLRSFAPGSCALLGDLPCRVIAVTLREAVFVYQVTWRSGSERRLDSVSACELTAVADSTFLTIQAE